MATMEREGTWAVFSSPKEILLRTQGALLEFQLAHEKRFIPEVVNKSIQWVTPPMGWVLFNKDAAIQKDRGWVGIGVLLRDHPRKMIMAKSLTLRGYLDPVEVEALAAVTTTQPCRSWGIDRVLFIGDVKRVVDDINNGKTWSSLQNPNL